MRRDVGATGSTLTCGELRAAMEGLDDAVPVIVDSAGEYDIGSVLASDLSLVLTIEEIHTTALWGFSDDES